MDGNRGKLLVPEGDAQCQRINSLYVQTTQGGYFEFGWVIGWSNCAGFRNQFYHEATPFAWWTNNSGATGCRVFENRNPDGDQYHNFRVSDLNSNTYWGSWLNGSELQPSGVNLDFSQGLGAVGMERGDAGDNGYTRFLNLTEYHDGNQWSQWDNLVQNVDTDPGYRLRIDAGDAGATVQ